MSLLHFPTHLTIDPQSAWAWLALVVVFVLPAFISYRLGRQHEKKDLTSALRSLKQEMSGRDTIEMINRVRDLANGLQEVRAGVTKIDRFGTIAAGVFATIGAVLGLVIGAAVAWVASPSSAVLPGRPTTAMDERFGVVLVVVVILGALLSIVAVRIVTHLLDRPRSTTPPNTAEQQTEAPVA